MDIVLSQHTGFIILNVAFKEFLFQHQAYGMINRQMQFLYIWSRHARNPNNNITYIQHLASCKACQPDIYQIFSFRYLQSPDNIN